MEPVAFLTDVTSVLAAVRRSVKVQVDLKDQYPLSRDEARRFLRAIDPLRANAHLKVVVGCLGDWNLRTLRRLDPSLSVGLDFALYLDAAVPEFPRLPMRVNVYGYLDDYPLGYRPGMPVHEYLEDRVESLCHLLPGAEEVYLRVELILHMIADGLNPVEIIRRQLGRVLIDGWTLNADSTETARTLQAVLDVGVDQITTDTAVQLAALIQPTAAKPGGRDRGSVTGDR